MIPTNGHSATTPSTGPYLLIEASQTGEMRIRWEGLPANPLLLMGLLEEAKMILREHFRPKSSSKAARQAKAAYARGYRKR